MWCRCPSIAKPMPPAISSCNLSISGLENSKIAPHERQMKWSWWARFHSGSKGGPAPQTRPRAEAPSPVNALAREARLLQQLERAVDGGAPDVPTPTLHQAEQLLDREVSPR